MRERFPTPPGRCWCCGLRRCGCCHAGHDCRWLFGAVCCGCRANDLIEEAAHAALTYNGDAPVPPLTRIGYSPEQIAAIPPPWDAHVPAFVVDDEGPGCACCGAGSCWCECRCGLASPRYSCAQEARRWHIAHVRASVEKSTSMFRTGT